MKSLREEVEEILELAGPAFRLGMWAATALINRDGLDAFIEEMELAGIVKATKLDAESELQSALNASRPAAPSYHHEVEVSYVHDPTEDIDDEIVICRSCDATWFNGAAQ